MSEEIAPLSENQGKIKYCAATFSVPLIAAYFRAKYLRVIEDDPSLETDVMGPHPCGIADPSTRDCKNMKEVGGGMDGERYRCDVCGKGYFLDYDEMK